MLFIAAGEWTSSHFHLFCSQMHLRQTQLWDFFVFLSNEKMIEIIMFY